MGKAESGGERRDALLPGASRVPNIGIGAGLPGVQQRYGNAKLRARAVLRVWHEQVGPPP